MVDRGLFDDQKGNLSKGIDSRIPTREGAKVLPPGYAPGEWDVICHSGKEAQDHSKFITANFSHNFAGIV